MSEINTVVRLRFAVMFLGEKSQHQWWETSFLNSLGLRYLGLVFPKTAALSAVTAASEAACRVHDERIGRGRVWHLFRLAPDAERPLGSTSRLLDELQTLCSQPAAFDLLDSIAGAAEPLPGTGPIRAGSFDDLGDKALLCRLAATYASGFRSGTPVFPYFA